MPAIVGAVNIISIGTSSIFHIGDVQYITPQSNVKTYAGGGSFNTGEGIQIHLGNSNTVINDSDKVDQPE